MLTKYIFTKIKQKRKTKLGLKIDKFSKYLKWIETEPEKQKWNDTKSWTRSDSIYLLKEKSSFFFSRKRNKEY